MIKILLKSDWKRFNIKMKQQREKLREQHSVLLQQENEIANLRATIIGLKADIEDIEKVTVSARSRLRACKMVIDQKKVTPTNKLKEILLILE